MIPSTGPTPAAIMLVGEKPDAEDELMNAVFSGRKGDLLDKLLGQAGILPASVFKTYALRFMGSSDHQVKQSKAALWSELSRARPTVVVAMGAAPTKLLLKKNSVRLGQIAGRFLKVPYMGASVVPWYSASYLLSRGRETDAQTLDFFRKVKLRAEAPDDLVP